MDWHSHVSAGFTPSAPELRTIPRRERGCHLWQMHRPSRPHEILTAALLETDAGLELRVGFPGYSLIRAQFRRTDDGALLERAEDLRLVLLGHGWIELRATDITH